MGLQRCRLQDHFLELVRDSCCLDTASVAIYWTAYDLQDIIVIDYGGQCGDTMLEDINRYSPNTKAHLIGSKQKKTVSYIL